MIIQVPEFSLVVLIGASGSGKSTFARKHFKPTEVLSSDYCRGLVSDDENDQSATEAAFAVLHFIASKRLAAGKVVVIDATNVRSEDRKVIIDLARQYHALPVAIVFNLPERICQERNKSRQDRQFGSHVVRSHRQQLRRSLRGLGREGFRHVHVLNSPEEVDSTSIERTRLWNNLKHEHGPFDIIGDVHGCIDELKELLSSLGYQAGNESELAWTYRHPENRQAIFVGDLVDRGPGSPEVLRIVMNMVEAGSALCVPGNHDMKLLRKLRGKNVQVSHGLAETLKQLESETPEFSAKVERFIDDLVSHYVLDGGKLVVAHAGMKTELQGRASGKVREFALYGETTGETDEFGLPVRANWALEYRGEARVVYGHTPVPEPQWLNRTINIDTGCVFGGKLTALRYPEMELVSVDARQVYSQPAKPFLPPDDSAQQVISAQQEHDDILDLADAMGKRIITTRLGRTITIREGNAAAAIEVMSRFAIDPKWLIYLPPTMSPVETSQCDGLLEHPAEAFEYFRNAGVQKVICEQKHMGSRAIVVLCRDKQVARHRFGVVEDVCGVCFTRTGRRFFIDDALETQFIARLVAATNASNLWEELSSDWICLDCELMPWSAKAQALLREQYAAVGSAATGALPHVVAALERAHKRSIDTTSLLERFQNKEQSIKQYIQAYRQYCWPVQSIGDYKLAPFHILASENAVHADMDHLWHMQMIAKLCSADAELLLATPYQMVDLANEDELRSATDWWTQLTDAGGEGMVVKPLEFTATSPRGLIQPAVKCRGREYLRIVYGPDYTAPENLQRLRERGLSAKRSLAIREYALGIEALERFIHHEPLRRVHECVFGVLALESEPVDPRL